MNNAFLSRWGLPEEGDEQKLKRYINRFLTLTEDDLAATWDTIRLHAYSMGVSPNEYGIQGSFSSESWFSVSRYMRTYGTLPELAWRIELLFNSDLLESGARSALVRLTNDSRIGIRIVRNGKKYTTYPEGEQLLDEYSVEKPLTFLSGDASSELVAALEEYKAGKWVSSAEKIRRTLEEYLREYFGNKKGLQANIDTLGKHLKQHGVSDHFRNEIMAIVKSLDDGFNDASKHGSKVSSDAEAEFLIYVAGTLMNVLNKIQHETE